MDLRFILLAGLIGIGAIVYALFTGSSFLNNIVDKQVEIKEKKILAFANGKNLYCKNKDSKEIISKEKGWVLQDDKFVTDKRFFLPEECVK
jgi:hypothetical protein